MEKFVPYEKLSKKKKREIDLKKRRTWDGFDPVTRKTADKTKYDRRKFRRADKDGGFLFSAF